MELLCMFLLIFGFIIEKIETSWIPDYTANFEDHTTYVLSLGKFNDEDLNEMIKPEDLAHFPSINNNNNNNNKYNALHLHAERYNKRAVDKEQKNFKHLLEISKNAKENNFIEFKSLKKFNESEDSRGLRELERSATELSDYGKDYQENDSFVIARSTNDSYSEKKYESIGEEIEEEEDYDYESLKAEYDQQIIDSFYKNETFNFTDDGQPEDTPKEFVKDLVVIKKPRNCTQAELTKFGLKSFECLMFDYQHAIKNKTDIKLLLIRTWMVIRIWFFIYICIAIPCWCQKGWCCCCFRCEFCFPTRRIQKVRNYYALNPPGKFVEKPLADPEHPLIYEPTKAEKRAYRDLGKELKKL
ncbi:uncharacterized protein LOC130675983 [Microplitis mediator]|uniref:uncharacterized protein LOC130675983 n=1 Tax=Microplitis mediator TaxID=375433 RepID=UPI00255508CD|nr:uncharacterized protein LOC130675983 [Microplitis mediator]